MTSATMSRADCGFARYQARYKIREVLDSHDMSMAKLARRIGVTPVAVQATVRGKNHSRRILAALREVGVPDEILFDPNVV